MTLAAKLRRSHFLFLGYSLRDWNLRVILHRIWGEQQAELQVLGDPARPRAPSTREFWEQRGVEILDVALEDYVDELARRARRARCAPVRRP